MNILDKLIEEFSRPLEDDTHIEYVCPSEDYSVRFYTIKEHAEFIFANGQTFSRPMSIEQRNYFLKTGYWHAGQKT